MTDLSRLRVDGRRLERDFEELSAIGSTGDGGVHRPALSEPHLEARHWFRRRIEQDGFEFLRDAAGNHGALLPSNATESRTLLLGSHLDSVPRGGRFDGALGVLAAYEVLRTVREAGVEFRLHLEAIDFTDEEGTHVGLLGSRALAGTLDRGELDRPRGGAEALIAGFARAGLDPDDVSSAARPPESLAAFLELHIEQGPRLIDAARHVGIVTAIVGIGSMDVTFVGRADHAGTTPVAARRDAGRGAAAMITRGTATLLEEFPDCVVNFGRARFEPGAYNIVPERAILGVEYRAPDHRRLEQLEARLREVAAACAGPGDLQLEIHAGTPCSPAPCSAVCVRAFEAAVRRLGLSYLSLTSGAGHDTMALAAVCPSGMIFIPSTGGSHSPREHARWSDCVNGANVMLHAALEIARRVD